MARRKRGRKAPFWKKIAKTGLGLLGVTVGAGVALSPTYRGLGQVFAGDPKTGFNSIVYDTTGMDPAGGHLTPDLSKIVGTGVLAGVGIGLIMLFRMIAKRV